MRNLSTAYKTSASSDARNYTINLHVWKKTVDDNGNVSFPSSSKATYTSGNDLISMSIVDGQTSGNSFQLGQTFCPIISFTTVPNLNIKTGDKVQVELVFTSKAKATLATGYVDEYSYDSIDYAVSYTAYGKMLQLDKDYNSALTYPATFAAIVGEICSQNGLAFDTFAWKCNAKLKAKPVFGNLDNGDPAYPSAREMLGIIAGVNGCNVIITADEKVKFVPYTDTKTGITYEDAFSRQVNNEKYVIKKAVLNDGGQTSGDEAGYVELYFPLETVEGKASCLEKLNSVITGLSVMGMTVQTQGKGYYEIGDMLSYTDFDGEKYTLGIMGIKYDFGGGYFTETLYSLAPSEMEEQYKGNVRYSSASTTLKNPIVLSENTSSYLQYNYTVIGYRKGDKLTEAKGSKSFFIGGFKISKDWPKDSLVGNQALSFDDLAPEPRYENYPKNLRASFRILQVNADGSINWTLDYSYLNTSTGENVVHRGTTYDVTTNGTAPLFLTNWLTIHSPSETYPYGYAELYIGVRYYDKYGELTGSGKILPSVIQYCNPCFTSIAEYNAAINLTSEPLIAYDVSQEVMQIVEGDTPADLPEYGNSQTLYLTTNPAASWKYDVSKQKYVCVGRNYRELQRIKSSTEESTALEVFNVPVIFDCRTKTEWELEANTVYPKGFMIFEQEADTREVTKLKIANGIDKLSDLKYTNVTESELPTKTSQLENDSGFLTSYELPIASKTELGGVKVGTNLSISEDGTLSAETDVGNLNIRPRNLFIGRQDKWSVSENFSLSFSANNEIAFDKKTTVKLLQKVERETQALYSNDVVPVTDAGGFISGGEKVTLTAIMLEKSDFCSGRIKFTFRLTNGNSRDVYLDPPYATDSGRAYRMVTANFVEDTGSKLESVSVLVKGNSGANFGFYSIYVINSTVDTGYMLPLEVISTSGHTHVMDDITDLPEWTKSENKPTYTADEVGAAAKSHTHTKSQITDFPESLPANGGHADTATTLSDWSGNVIADADNAPLGFSKVDGGSANNPFVFWATLLTLGESESSSYKQQWAFPWGCGEALGKPKYRVKDNGTWFAWQSLPDGGNADTVDGKHASDFATAEDVSSAVSAVQIGGRNLLLGTGEISVIEGTNTADQYLAHHDLACGSIVNLDPGVYTCSADIIGTVEGGTAHMQFYGTPWETIPEMSGNVTVKTTKQKIGGTFTLSSPQTFSATGMRVRTDYVSGTITVSNMKLEKGNKPTDWTPAPEDYERRIASLEARVAALEAAAVSGGE